MHEAQPRLDQSDVTRGVPGGRARHGRAGIGMALAAVAILASGIGCASGGSSDTGAAAGAPAAAAAPSGGARVCDYGCLVPGPRVANTLSISATDTLPEINPRTTLRSAIANAINQHVTQNGWSSGRCLRKFGGPNVYVVMFHRTCESGPDPGPGMVVGFQANGTVIGQVNWIGPTTVGAMIPDRRN